MSDLASKWYTDHNKYSMKVLAKIREKVDNNVDNLRKSILS